MTGQGLLNVGFTHTKMEDGEMLAWCVCFERQVMSSKVELPGSSRRDYSIMLL